MKKKLQVFVSSTYTDLKEERQAAVEAILTAGHIPAGMELFAAGNVSQLELIKKWIEESDVYMLILGGRYGSIEPETQKSYTHIEYDYALEKGIPVFAVFSSDNALALKKASTGHAETETDSPEKYDQFKKQVLSKISRPFDDAKDIKLAILHSLGEIEKDLSLSGWISVRELQEVEELRRDKIKLLNENELLKKQIPAVSTEKIGKYSYNDIITSLSKERVYIPPTTKILSGKNLPDNISVWEAYVSFQQYFDEGIFIDTENIFEKLLYEKIAPRLKLFDIVKVVSMAGTGKKKARTTPDGQEILRYYLISKENFQ